MRCAAPYTVSREKAGKKHDSALHGPGLYADHAVIMIHDRACDLVVSDWPGFLSPSSTTVYCIASNTHTAKCGGMYRVTPDARRTVLLHNAVMCKTCDMRA